MSRHSAEVVRMDIHAKQRSGSQYERAVEGGSSQCMVHESMQTNKTRAKADESKVHLARGILQHVTWYTDMLFPLMWNDPPFSVTLPWPSK